MSTERPVKIESAEMTELLAPVRALLARAALEVAAEFPGAEVLAYGEPITNPIWSVGLDVCISETKEEKWAIVADLSLDFREGWVLDAADVEWVRGGDCVLELIEENVPLTRDSASLLVDLMKQMIEALVKTLREETQ